jgi:hypothetical protein
MKEPFSFIRVGQEESLFLDFKEKSRPDRVGLDKDDRRNYAKAISGFSNASGGVVVWGVRAKKESEDAPDVAIELYPISALTHFVTRLNELTSQAVIPLNTGVLNEKIPLDGQEDRGYALTYVPSSDLPPHRALLGVGQYYTRAGDSFVPMEHYMLSEAFGRRQRPKLVPCYRIQLSSSNREVMHMVIFVGLRNTGRHLAVFPAVRLMGTGEPAFPMGDALDTWFRRSS